MTEDHLNEINQIGKDVTEIKECLTGKGVGGRGLVDEVRDNTQFRKKASFACKTVVMTILTVSVTALITKMLGCM